MVDQHAIPVCKFKHVLICTWSVVLWCYRCKCSAMLKRTTNISHKLSQIKNAVSDPSRRLHSMVDGFTCSFVVWYCFALPGRGWLVFETAIGHSWVALGRCGAALGRCWDALGNPSAKDTVVSFAMLFFFRFFSRLTVGLSWAARSRPNAKDTVVSFAMLCLSFVSFPVLTDHGPLLVRS